MRQSLWDKRIPTLLGILFIGIGISLVTVLAQRRIIFFGNAAPSDIPKNMQVTNITDSSFTVTYTTDAKVLGVVSYGIDKNTPQTALDDRDQATSIPTQHTVHSITVAKLQPKTPYYFSIKSSETNYLHNNTLFQADTGPRINAPPTNQKPLTGKIVTVDGNTPSDVLVFVQNDAGQLLSTVVKPTGFFIVPLNTWRDKTVSSYINAPAQLNIEATDGVSVSQASFSLGGENIVPVITLSKNYDFTRSEVPLASQSASLFSLPVFTASSSGGITPAITTPNNNQGLVDSQPEIKGIAPPNASVEITIHSAQTITGNVTANNSGLWSFRPTSPLAPGVHTISVTIRDATGAIIKKLQQSFTVYAQGSQVDQSATPSAAVTFTPTPTTNIVQTLTPTFTPTVTPPVTISSAISGTPTPTLLAFGTGTQSPSTPTPSPKLVTGSASLPFIGIMGVITLVAGIAIFFATQGSSL